MGMWDNTTYLECGDPQKAADAIAALFRLDGYKRIELSPQEITKETAHLARYSASTESPLFAAAVLETGRPWLIVKSAPLDLMIWPARWFTRPRLGSLSAHLQCNALHVCIYDEDTMFCIESDASGDCCISGSSYEEADALYYMREPQLIEEREEPQDRSKWRNPFLDPGFIAKLQQGASAAPTNQPLPAPSRRLERKPFLQLRMHTFLQEAVDFRLELFELIEAIGIHLTGKGSDFWGNQVQGEMLSGDLSKLPPSIVTYFRR